jgi:signal transduction histidine kinase/ligand-binding sensor domain-containing protein
MKKILILFLSSVFFLATTPAVHAQQKIFQLVTSANNRLTDMDGITQDKQGYIWLTGADAEHGFGLFRYDGTGFTFYSPDSANSNGFQPRGLCIDSSGMIWIGTHGRGLYRFDPVAHAFTHFQHSAKDPASLASDSITIGGLLEDHEGNLWIGTRDGLDMLRHNTGNFIHFKYKPGDTSGLSSNFAIKLYEDKEGNLWVGCVGNLPGTKVTGGLNLFHPSTGTFSHYLPDPQNPQSPANTVSSIYEDSMGTLWIGTGDNGLLTLNRNTGAFTRYPPYDPDHPEKLGSLPLRKGQNDFITFITGDARGKLWIGTFTQGIQSYESGTGKATHYGFLMLPSGKIIADTAAGYGPGAFNTLLDKNGFLWIGAVGGNLFYINPFQENIPYESTKQAYVNAFYKDKKGSLWIATDGGLLYKPVQGKEKLYIHQPNNPNSPSITGISTMIADSEGNLWLGTYDPPAQQKLNVLDKFNPVTGKFTHYTDSGKLKGSRIWNLCFDDDEHSLWIGGLDGLYKMNTQTGEIIRHYQYNRKDTNGISGNKISNIMVYGNFLWAATNGGLDRLDKKSGRWQYYLKRQAFLCIYKDAKGILWAGSANGLFRFDPAQNRFHRYRDTITGFSPLDVSNIQEDSRYHLWVTGTNAIYRISAKRDSLYIYGVQNGVELNTTAGAINYQAQDGKLYMGNPAGYYSFYPDSLNTNFIRPELNITGFQLGNKEILPGRESLLKKPLYQTEEIKLGHTQNSFSFDFAALNYTNTAATHYRYMLQGYDNRWHDAGELHKAYFFGVPVGHYVFKVMAINSNNAWSEKDITIIISPPWWTTWWAILVFIAILAGIIWAIVYWRSRQLRRANKLLEEKIDHRTKQLQESIENLKSTQKQLIQSEKMASLGELTAGIAHEIQNPLNFVNNFSEVNKEILEELNAERLKPKAERNDDLESAILKDIKDNEEKILHHGKRANAIVKGMLQHSRASSGQKELTDINALCDEYLRLSYHGMRAKDKEFNAEIKTDFDNTIEKINIVPQDIGRVLLNLFNNAFYAVSEKKKLSANSYQPLAEIKTRRINDHVEISVSDNGNGIPQNIKNKIFQPFFTTKPTGSGTGLGLSLSYDIVKAHGGEIKVESLSAGAAAEAGKEREGTEFIVSLPA